jgi:hypothetical protein
MHGYVGSGGPGMSVGGVVQDLILEQLRRHRDDGWLLVEVLRVLRDRGVLDGEDIGAAVDDLATARVRGSTPNSWTSCCPRRGPGHRRPADANAQRQIAALRGRQARAARRAIEELLTHACHRGRRRGR